MALPQLSPKIEDLVRRYSESWLKAEAAVKKSELIVGEVISSSINELRYAGRRFNDFLVGWASNSPEEELRVHLIEAIENCRKARHDAIDEVLFQVNDELHVYEKAAGIDILSQHFDSYDRLLGALDDARDVVSFSREDRKRLDEHYEKFESGRYLDIIEYWKELRRAQKVITVHRSRQRRDFWIVVVGIALVVGMIGDSLVNIADKRGLFDWSKPTPKVAPPEPLKSPPAPAPTPPTEPAPVAVPGKALSPAK